MESAERKKLLNYIKAAIDLETEIATQEQMALSVNNTWDTKKPSFIPDELPKEQIAYESTESGGGWIALLVCDIPPFIFAASTSGGSHDPSIPRWGWIITFAIAALAIGLKVKDMRKSNAARERNIEKTRKFNEKCNQVTKENEKNEKAYERNLRKWNESKNDIATFRCYSNETDKYYFYNVIEEDNKLLIKKKDKKDKIDLTAIDTTSVDSIDKSLQAYYNNHNGFCP